MEKRDAGRRQQGGGARTPSSSSGGGPSLIISKQGRKPIPMVLLPLT